MRKRSIALAAAGVVAGGLYAVNNSWSADPADQRALLAHAGPITSTRSVAIPPRQPGRTRSRSSATLEG